MTISSHKSKAIIFRRWDRIGEKSTSETLHGPNSTSHCVQSSWAFITIRKWKVI